VLSQFTANQPGQRTLAESLFRRASIFGKARFRSEGLLLLSDEPGLNTRLLESEARDSTHHWAQIEGVIDAPALRELEAGVTAQGKKTRAATAANARAAPDLPPRDPPFGTGSCADELLALEISEGRNRQVRRNDRHFGTITQSIRCVSRYAHGRSDALTAGRGHVGAPADSVPR